MLSATTPLRNINDVSPADATIICNQNTHRYNNWAFQPILNQHFNRLRARLLNLAESSTRDKQQSEAMKGLMKDFVNEAYYAAIRDVEDFCRDFGVIAQGEGSNAPNHDRLTAQSMKDILYEPELS